MKIIKINSSHLIFLSIAFLYASGNFIWWILNSPIFVVCPASAGHFVDITKNSLFYTNAPLFTWIIKIFIYAFGKTFFDLITIFVNYMFFLTAIYFLYKIGCFLKNKETGNYAMVLFSLIPAVYGMSRQYGHQDYHIITFITFNIYTLLKTNSFENKKWALLYGVSTGLGLMIKDSFSAYFFIPFLYTLIPALKQNLNPPRIKNILLSVMTTVLISCPHYCRPEIIKKVFNEPLTETVNIFTFENFRTTTFGILENFLSPLFFTVFVISLVFFIWKYKNRYKNIILLWVFVPWAIVTFMPHHKLIEYLAGVLPAQALIMAISLSLIKRNFLKNFFILIIFIAGTVQYVNLSYNTLNINALYFLPYNKHHPLIYYDKSLALQAKNLSEYLALNYSGKKFIVYDTYGFSISKNILQNFAYILDENIFYDYYYEGNPLIRHNDYAICFLQTYPNDKTINNNCINSVFSENFYICDKYYFKIGNNNYKMIILKNKSVI